ncbi:hypothetical protein GY45DRAFT_645819 [Cubamyces sp. BRFM 1775]|nr:hypothetical protein GY45DRAFT_645819 [Cubamyces sp. BRFM 1775]
MIVMRAKQHAPVFAAAATCSPIRAGTKRNAKGLKSCHISSTSSIAVWWPRAARSGLYRNDWKGDSSPCTPSHARPLLPIMMEASTKRWLRKASASRSGSCSNGYTCACWMWCSI